MLLVVLMIVGAVLAPLISPFSPSAQFSDYVLEGPGGRHLLGTDEFGRDVLSRIIWGTRVSLQVGLGAVVVGFLVGVPLGILAGFRGGGAEAIIMRCTDMLLAFPTLLLALIIVTALGGSLLNEIIAIGVALTPSFVRLARSMALTIKENDYIMAARALGGTPLRIMVRHIFPNAVSTLVVIATLYIANAIRTEAGLSFLGLGVPPPTASWGNILSEGRQFIKCCPWADDLLRPLHHARRAVVQHQWVMRCVTSSTRACGGIRSLPFGLALGCCPAACVSLLPTYRGNTKSQRRAHFLFPSVDGGAGKHAAPQGGLKTYWLENIAVFGSDDLRWKARDWGNEHEPAESTGHRHFFAAAFRRPWVRCGAGNAMRQQGSGIRDSRPSTAANPRRRSKLKPTSSPQLALTI